MSLLLLAACAARRPQFADRATLCAADADTTGWVREELRPGMGTILMPRGMERDGTPTFSSDHSGRFSNTRIDVRYQVLGVARVSDGEGPAAHFWPDRVPCRPVRGLGWQVQTITTTPPYGSGYNVATLMLRRPETPDVVLMISAASRYAEDQRMLLTIATSVEPSERFWSRATSSR